MHQNTEYIWSRSDAVPHMSVGSLRTSIDSEETNTRQYPVYVAQHGNRPNFRTARIFAEFPWVIMVDVARGQKQSDIQPRLLGSELHYSKASRLTSSDLATTGYYILSGASDRPAHIPLPKE